ncbi:radical SAM protein [Candidatus Kuenenbacteria bacterium]|nr:radical SAM protein [Candidatus Kuenenbacteria bacterium]
MKPLGSDQTAIQYLRYKFLGEEPLKDFIGLRPDTLCNYKCVSCKQVKGSCKTSEKEFQDILAEHGRQRVICSISGGEPLLTNEHFLRVLQHTRLCSTLGLYPTLFSNCHDLDGRKVEMLLEAGLKRLTTAFYGPDAASHDKWRGVPGSFVAQYRALKLICEKKRESRQEFELIVSMVFFRQNFRQLSEMIQMLGDIFGDEIDRLDFFPIKEYADLYLSEEDVDYFKGELLPRLLVQLHSYGFDVAGRKLQEILEGNPEDGVYGILPECCYSSHTSLYVSGHERLIYPCGYMSDYAERHPESAVVLGKVGEKLDLSKLKTLPMPICQSLCGPVVKGHNRRAQRAVEIMQAMPDLEQVLRLPSYENQLVLRLRREYIAMRDEKAFYRK